MVQMVLVPQTVMSLPVLACPVCSCLFRKHGADIFHLSDFDPTRGTAKLFKSTYASVMLSQGSSQREGP